MKINLPPLGFMVKAISSGNISQTVHSSDGNCTVVSSHHNNALSAVSIKSEWPEVQFEYQVELYTPNKGIWQSGRLKDGKMSPEADHIVAIQMKLVGAMAEKYKVVYWTTTSFFNSSKRVDSPQVESGFCPQIGLTNDEKAQAFISTLNISVQRK